LAEQAIREKQSHIGYLEALLAAELANLDWNAGRLFETLSRHSLLNETLIIFTSDHGRSWIDRRGSSEQRIALSYEEVARVPLILRYPARLPQGKTWGSGVTLAALAPKTAFDMICLEGTKTRRDRHVVNVVGSERQNARFC